MSNDQTHVAAALHDEDAPTNLSDNPHIVDLLHAGITRRQALQGTASAAVLGAFGYAGCAAAGYPKPGQAGKNLELGFSAVLKSLADTVLVPEGYTAKVLIAVGDPIAPGIPEWAGDGSETPESYEFRAGDHHDGMAFYGMNPGGQPNRNGSDRGLLCTNHEAMTAPFQVHPNGETVVGGVRTVVGEVIKELNCHGVSIVEIARPKGGEFSVQRGSAYNRRITASTPMEISGPLRGSDFARTKYSPDGTMTRGTVNNCAHGYTPWGTYLTCEENWSGYFRRGDDAAARSVKENQSLSRYGRGPNSTGRHRWDTAGAGDVFKRWDITVTGAASTDDFRNEINTYGWVVEIDPFDPTSMPRKRTALGRMAHEGCWPAKCQPGKPVVFYLGDDNRNDYIYKFVSALPYNPSATGLAAGDKYLDDGKLYVAKFNADGSGEWIELSYGVNGLDQSNAFYPFANQADVSLNSRLAADAVGATKMDRPEWGAVSPVNGEVYMTLTNNSNRRPADVVLSGSQLHTDPANPRSYDRTTGSRDTSLDGNDNGHIIRWRETRGNPAALSFDWDIYLFGARTAYPDAVDISQLSPDNDFSSPDGLWFDPRGLLWIQTDDGAYTDTTNCMMLAAIPGSVGDGSAIVVDNGVDAGGNPLGVATLKGANPTADTLRRFLVGPRECEITGVDITPDGSAMFVNVQHPGENGTLSAPLSTWPGGGSTRPRSATLVITRDDGGVIGLA